MTDFALAPEIEELRDAALRFAERELAPSVRESETAGRWSEHVLAVLDGFSLGALDLPESIGGTSAGCVAKVVVLEALASGDAGGLPGADRPGVTAGAVVMCPDTSLAPEVVAAGLSGEAQSALLVIDPDDEGPVRLPWGPGWPALRWVWTIDGDALSLFEVDTADETSALAFQASGGVSAALGGGRPVGRWTLEPGAGLYVRGRARLWTSAVAVGVAQAAFDATVTYTTDRVVFGKPVAHHQGNAFDLAVAATNIHATRLAVRDAASRFDEGDPHAGYWATQAWFTTMDTALHATDLGIQLLGGHGFLVDHIAEKRFREVGMLRLLAGGRDAAELDASIYVLEIPDPVFA